MVSMMSGVRVGLIGFGEVGSSLGAGMAGQGVQVVAFDKGYLSSPFGDLIQRKAREAGVPLARSVEEVVDRSDLILAVVPGSAAPEAASMAAARLGPGKFYVDMGTATPPMKERMAGMIEETGASFVDVAIMGSPVQDGHRFPTLASGRGAEEFRRLVEPLGMRVTVVGERPGRAAAIKMFRSIFMKGIEALVIETLMACCSWDVVDEVMGSISASLAKMPFYPDQTNFLVTTDAIHAERRAREMDMVVETMQAVGVEPKMSRATAEMIHWMASLGLKEHFGGELPSDWREVLDEVIKRRAVAQ